MLNIFYFITNNILKVISKLFPLKSIKLKICLGKLSENYFHKKINDKELIFYIENYHCYKRYSTIMTKEMATIKWLDNIKKNEVLWDIGANIGIYSIYAAKMKGAKVFSFEPIVNSAKVLRKNIELNKLQKKINIFVMGLGDKTKKLNLHYSSNHAGSARHQIIPLNRKLDNFEDIFVYKPDELIQHKILNFPNHIKIDTDGNELEILNNSKKILSSKKLKTLCIENEFGKNEKIRKYKIINQLKKYGFILTHKEMYVLGYNMYFKKKNKS